MLPQEPRKISSTGEKTVLKSKTQYLKKTIL
jgi:hypothetical protein